MNVLIIRGAKITDVENSSFSFGDLIVRDGHFVAVNDDSEPASMDADVIEAHGKTVIPGLIDAHFHAYAASFQGVNIDSSPLSFVALQGGRKLSAALRRGFTTVRDVAGGDHGLKRAVDLNVVAAPDYLFTGPALSQTGGHGDSRDPAADLCLHHSHMGEVVGV